MRKQRVISAAQSDGYAADPADEARRRAVAIVSEAIQKKGQYEQAWSEIYKECQADEEYALQGKQMDARTARKFGFGNNMQMPNLLKPYINNQANQTLQNNYRAKVIPNGGGSDLVKARQREGVLRGTQKNGAAMVYNQARRYQLASGIHYSRVVVDYASERGFANEYRYEDVVDTYNVFPDPYVQTSTFSDMRDFIIKEDVPKAMWKERTGQEWTFGAQTKRQLIYYWRRKSVGQEKEFLGVDGRGVLESQLPQADGQPDYSNIKMMVDGVTPFSRDVSVYEWEWFILQEQSKTIFHEGMWKGCYPPLVACTGEKVVEQTGDGQKVHYYSLIRDAKEPQFVYTVLENIILLRIARSPYSKWKIAFESIVLKQMQEYRQSSVIGENDVLYKAFTEDGQKAIPAPEEIEPHVLDAMLLELQQYQITKIERVLGIYDAALGQKTNEKSGIAIKERARQSNLSNYHFEFNFLEYVKQMGMVVLESMPNYLTAEQYVPFADKDDQQVMALINAPGGITFDPSEKYTLSVEVVPDSESSREAEAEALSAMMDNKFLAPILARAPGVPALVVKAQKGRYAQQIGEILEKSSNDPEKQEMAARMEAMQKEGQALQARLEQLESDKSLEAVKEQNRHAEKMAELQAKVAKDADDTEIKAFDAETKREQTNGIPQFPSSLTANDGLGGLV